MKYRVNVKARIKKRRKRVSSKIRVGIKSQVRISRVKERKVKEESEVLGLRRESNEVR